MEDNLKWESYVIEQKIDLTKVSEKIKNKIQVFEETYKNYEEADENDEAAIRDLEAKLHSNDEGIYLDLTSYVEERDKQADSSTQAAATPPKAEDGGITPSNSEKDLNSSKIAQKPSWRFWM